jgi:para-nitrobenzyl esterase
MQMPFGAIAAPPTDFAWQLTSIFPTPARMKIENEDCLFLNVWTPGLDT